VIRRDVEDSSTGPLGATVSAAMEMFFGERTGSCTVDVEFTTTLANPGQSETRVGPIVGFGARCRSSRWAVELRAGIGGFGIPSELPGP
jgi:hypothetical protein